MKDIRRKNRRRVNRIRGKRAPTPVLYLSWESKAAVLVVGQRTGMAYADIGPILLKLGLATFRSRETGEVKRLIELAVGSDYLPRFRSGGIEGVR